MCGRFVSASPPDELARYFGADAPDDQLLESLQTDTPGATPDADVAFEPRFNVAPSATVLAVVERDDSETGRKRRVEALHWGLVPFWAKDIKIGYKMFNARSETLASKNAFAKSFAKRRCLIPVDGFYEWQVVGDPEAKKPKKQPVFIHRVDGDPFAFAGIWESWRGPDRTDEPLRSCSIITGSPNTKMADYHDRMPVMLAPDQWDRWLDPSFHDTDELETFFVPAPSELLEIYPVSTAVNNARNRGSQLADRITISESTVSESTVSEDSLPEDSSTL